MLKQIKIGGEMRPINFGLWALSEISEALHLDQSKILEGMFVTKLADQITIVRIGLVEGAKKLARHFGVKPSQEILNLDDETLADWLDADPEALDGATSLYFEQCFGKKVEVLLAEMDKVEEMKPAADNLKNAWEKVTKTASQLPSLDLPKSVPAGLA